MVVPGGAKKKRSQFQRRLPTILGAVVFVVLLLLLVWAHSLNASSSARKAEKLAHHVEHHIEINTPETWDDPVARLGLGKSSSPSGGKSSKQAAEEAKHEAEDRALVHSFRPSMQTFRILGPADRCNRKVNRFCYLKGHTRLPRQAFERAGFIENAPNDVRPGSFAALWGLADEVDRNRHVPSLSPLLACACDRSC